MDSATDIYTEPLPGDYPLVQVARFFQSTLQQPKHEVSDQEINSQPVNANKNSTIIMDVQRTRSSFLPAELKPEMEKMLVHFCRLQKLEYKQGMNEILAPFAMMRTAGVTLSKCYSLFRSFFDQYCLNFYYDKDFNSLEIIFKMVTVMIKYHDPALARYLENYEIEPQIYCISWLMTLFSSKLSLRLTYTLWQFVAVQKDDYFIFFLIIAIIINRREEIIQTKCASIFTVITNLIFKDDSELTNTIKIALILRKTTPASLILFFREHKIFKERQSFERISYLLKSVDNINLFLVGPMQVSLKQHFSLGMCEKKCYFCTLKQPVKLNYPSSALNQYFPILAFLLSLSDDVRTMDFSPQFILVDIRGDKTKKLAKIEGIKIFEVDTKALIEEVQARFNEQFMQSRGREHFLFLLNNFSFEKEESTESEEFYFCNKLIKILNSYSYCYLSMLEGGEASYSYFLKELKLKSELLNSKLMPVSEYNEQEELIGDNQDEDDQIVGSDRLLELSEIVAMQQKFDRKKYSIFEGEDNSQDYLMFILEGLLLVVERNGLLEKLIKFVRQKKSIINHIIDQQYVLKIPFKVTFLHSLFRIEKLTARVHHNNQVLFYVQEAAEEALKKYRRGDRKQLWKKTIADIISQDLLYLPSVVKRIPFESMSFDVVKEISSAVKSRYREVVRVKRQLQQQNQRFEDLNKNIIEEFDAKDEVEATNLDF